MRYLIALCLLCGVGLNAQTTVSELLVTEPETASAGGTTGTAYLLNTYYHDTRWESIYLASELTAAGILPNSFIYSLHIKCAEIPGKDWENHRIRMQHTSLTTIPTTWTLSGWTTVHGPVTTPAANFTVGNWLVCNFSTPFLWNGTDNLLIDFTTDATSFVAGGASYHRTVSTARSHGGRQDSTLLWPYDTTTNPSNLAFTVNNATLVPSLRLEHALATAGVSVTNNSTGNEIVGNSGTDRVVMRLSAQAIINNMSLNSVTFTKTGTAPNGAFTTVKLVRDVNSDGQVDAGDVTLGSGPLTGGGTVTFSGAPLQQVTPAANVRLLLAVTYPGPLAEGTTMEFEIASAAAATWVGGTDHSGYPMKSGIKTMEPPQIQLGSTASTSGNTIPFNAATPYRHMTVYSAADLGSLPTGSIITGLRIHSVSAIPSPLPTWGTMKVLIGPAATTPSAMSGTFDLNYSSPGSVVLDAVNFTPIAMPGTLTASRFVFPFTAPYMYNGGDIVIEFQMSARTIGTGFNIVSLTGRQRVYSAVTPLPATGTLTTTAGNFGLALDYIASPNGALLGSVGVAAEGIAPPMTDRVIMRFNAMTFNAARNLNSITFTQIGTISNAAISNVKLVRDNNSDGLVDAGDTVLGSGTLTAGAITFSGSPLQAVSTAASVPLLFAASLPAGALPLGTTMRFSIASSAAVSWTPAGDLTGYPITSGEWVQRMSGNFTIAQSGPADFNDIGAAFDALESLGVSGPVTLTITDSATYQSTPSYTLGYNSVTPIPARAEVVGASATNRITLRAAPGQTPKIQGNATGAILAPSSSTVAQTGRGGLVINQSYVTVEGLEVFGGPHFGIMAQGNNVSPILLNTTDIIIRRCKVYDIPNGPGIAHMGLNSGFANNMIIEHNFVWNCLTVSLATSPDLQTLTNGAITVRNAAQGTTIVRHNTVLHTSTLAGTGGYYAYSSSAAYPVADFSNNIIISTNATIPALYLSSTTYVPTVANFNCFFATVLSNQATAATFALWQGLGKDANGLNTDPLLVSTTGTIDLHLSATSPCIDPVGQTSTATIDIDGDTRPVGASTDIGADEFNPPASMDVLFNAAPVANNGNVNIGQVPQAGEPFQFTINNTGPGVLNLTGSPIVAITLDLNLDAGTVVQVQPALTALPATTGTTTFTLFVDPAALGQFELTVSIANNDSLKNPYVFVVAGTAIPDNMAPVANIAVGSSFAGAQNGPFSQAVNPGSVLTSAEISLSDPELDTVTVTNLVPPVTPLTGVTGPALPLTGHPVTLSWTGAPDGSNAPGNYTWSFTFIDAVNGTPVNIDVTITLNDVAPQHIAAAGVTGNGSAGTPYLSTATVGLTGAASRNIAVTSDENTGQAVSISGINDVSNLGGTGFQFALNAGTLVASPAGTLVAADAGTQVWEVTITDGTNPVVITVSINVAAAITFTSPATLMSAQLNGTYPGDSITTAGGTGAISFAVTGGALPANLTLSATGSLSGTTTGAVGAYNFAVTATDSLGASSVGNFSIDVIDPPAGLPVITNGSTLPNGTLNASYGPLTLTVSGGTGPYTFSLESGNLPTGMSLSASGVISGTPSVIATETFTVRVVDGSARNLFNTGTFTLTVVAPKKDDDGGSCAAGASGSILGLLMMGGIAAIGRRRRK